MHGLKLLTVMFGGDEGRPPPGPRATQGPHYALRQLKCK
jgi:hypothetical protein